MRTRQNGPGRILALVVALAAVAGCGATTTAPPTSPPPVGPFPTAPGATPTSGLPRSFDICALVPLADVEKILEPALAGQEDSQPPVERKSVTGGCSYDFRGDPWVAALIDPADFASEDDARASYRGQRDEILSQRTGHDLSGLGEEAFVSDEGYNAGIRLRSGTLVLMVVVRVDDAAFDFRTDLATKLAKLALERLD